jgi:hypothetical protein
MIMLLALVMMMTAQGATASADHSVAAKVSSNRIYLDGQFMDATGFTIAGNNYFRLRDIAEMFSVTTSRFNVTWNGGSNSVELVTGDPYEKPESEQEIYYSPNKTYSAKPSASRILIDGQAVSMTAYVIDGSTYFKLRDLGANVPFDVKLGEFNEIYLYSQTPQNAYRAEMAYDADFNLVSSDYPRWQNPVESNLIRNADGTVSVIEVDEGLTIETYDASYRLLAKKKLDLELPLFGAFYSGEKYNYVAYGQENREENDDKEVIRIVRYDKNFVRIDSVSVRGGESFTTVPFDAGSGRMAESGNTLVFHTARERYTTEDGKNHQSQLTILVDTSTMSVTNDLGRFQENHVSHSFDQYALFDGNEHVLLDHGDAYPRSIVLSKGTGSSYVTLDLFAIPGAIGANMTGVSVGGFGMSSADYLVAMNSIDHSKVSEYTSFDMIGLEKDQRDVILVSVPRNNLTTSAVRQTTIAKYIGTDKYASIPKLVKLDDDKLMVLWQEFDEKQLQEDLKYVFVDAEGQPIGDIQAVKNFVLSECQPIVVDNKVIWYAQENGMRTFYSIPLSYESRFH